MLFLAVPVGLSTDVSWFWMKLYEQTLISLFLGLAAFGWLVVFVLLQGSTHLGSRLNLCPCVNKAAVLMYVTNFSIHPMEHIYLCKRLST